MEYIHAHKNIHMENPNKNIKNYYNDDAVDDG